MSFCSLTQRETQMAMQSFTVTWPLELTPAC